MVLGCRRNSGAVTAIQAARSEVRVPVESNVSVVLPILYFLFLLILHADILFSLVLLSCHPISIKRIILYVFLNKFIYIAVGSQEKVIRPVTDNSAFCRIHLSRCLPTVSPEDDNRHTSRNPLFFSEYSKRDNVQKQMKNTEPFVTGLCYPSCFV